MAVRVERRCRVIVCMFFEVGCKLFAGHDSLIDSGGTNSAQSCDSHKCSSCERLGRREAN